MGRHSLPDDDMRGGGRSRPRVRRRTVAGATMLVLAVAAGTGVAAQSGLLSFADSCKDAAVRLDVVASPDIAPAVRAVADSARQQEVTSDGQCMDVRVTARENYKVAQELAVAGNKPEYEVWLPDSALWAERTKALGDGVPLTPAGNVAVSPIALATVHSAGTELGWPGKTYTWAELTAAATTTETLRLGAADPARSATGLLALTSVSASTQKSGPDADTKVAATAKALSRRVSPADSQVVRTLARDGSAEDVRDPRRNQAVFLSEQAAYAYNSATSYSTRDLELFYPKDSAPRLDYPYQLVDESELSTDESRAATRFMALLGEPEPRRTLAAHGFRAADEAAAESLVRTAGGRAPQPFTATETAAPLRPDALQETLGLWTITVQSARLTTVVDVSGSMQAPVPGRDAQTRLDVTKASLLQAMEQFTPEDEIGLWEFATGLDGPRDYRKLVATARLGAPGKGGGTHRAQLAEAVKALAPVPEGATGLYDTTLAAYKEAQGSYVKGKFNALVILTDGSNQDRFSITRSELLNQLKKLSDPQRPVPLIAIAVGPDADLREADQIARAAGGAGYQVSDPAEIQAVILKAIMAVGQAGQAAQE
ncbi:substrate-binding domain-containing protein [Streptomyces lunaelactis]|uniref:substrate-binding domain-containing protein n=1 Tax=Streptomyces lunaelactis TaxID=1535768 RepID=UPI0015855CD2|nr:substrate-binding domain-containing protein [Streptomyces lunaelactis]NUK37938.1 substrate-binding domain-containing protein [Streptomyces lunaelactis]NUK44970.1 substrate-binding domain-containing protein [Streptomyces lunaelactis]NUK96244.1 substrate-binding domain-containing protein [Streptomyces lunaelactis]